MEEQELDGRQWAALGIYWAERPEQNGARTLECFRHAAALGNPSGISNLGWCMESGVGTEADPRQAVWLYRQAADPFGGREGVSGYCHLCSGVLYFL